MISSGVRLQDVADLAGVSIGTASQALNNKPNVAPETRARVIDAARSLGYPVRGSVTEASSPVEVVGMLTKHDFGHAPEVNPFYTHVQLGVENECREHNISLMYANIEVDPSNHPVMWPSMLNEQRIDGLLLVGTFIDDTVGFLRRRLDLPTVLIDSYAPQHPFDSVVIDNIPGAAAAVEYLIEQGHRDIGLIGSNPNSPPSILDRRQGFRSVLERHGLSLDYVENSPTNQTASQMAAKRLLERAPSVTAIFACNDVCAMGVLGAARELGLVVPDDLSVMGFDNIDITSVITPALTTVHVHKTWLGALGVRQLLQRTREPRQPRVTVCVSTELVVRDSVCRRVT